MKRILSVLGCVCVLGLTVMAQDWSEYSRGSESWHRHNRDAMFRPWKYDKGGRLKRGKHHVKKHGKRH